MKPLIGGATNALEGREFIRAQSNGEKAPLGLLFEGGGLAGDRRLSRRQAIGLLGGSLAGVSLLSLGLAAPAKAALPNATIKGPVPPYAAPRLSAAKTGNWWDVTVEWFCVCEPFVVNHTFQTNWTLLESDDTSGHDVISATVEPHLHSAHSPVKTFIPSQANPSNPQVVSFKETIGWHRDDLDTELGGEEIYARVRVRDATANSSYYWRKTEQQFISP